MNKIYFAFLLFVFFLANAKNGYSQVSGIAFRDFNGNGTRQSTTAYSEPFAKGIIVNVFNSSDVLIASFTTNAIGAYTIPASGTVYNGTKGSNTGFVPSGTDVRVEFEIPATGSCLNNPSIDFPSSSGSTFGTSIQFVTGGTANVNFAFNDPDDYYNDVTPFSATDMYVNKYTAGNATGSSTAAAANAFYKFPYSNNQSSSANNGATPVSATALATNAQIGTTYGVAYSKYAKKIFTSAYFKRHYGFGPANGTFNNAPGAIYIIDPSLTSATGAATYFTSLDALSSPTHNSTGSPAYGSGTSYNISGTGVGATISYPTNGLGVIGTNTARGLNADLATKSSDPAAFGQIGKVSLGDMDISSDGLYLYLINLFDRKLYVLQLNDIVNPTSATVVNSFAIPNPPLTHIAAYISQLPFSIEFRFLNFVWGDYKLFSGEWFGFKVEGIVND
jgi:hypothetical protein